MSTIESVGQGFIPSDSTATVARPRRSAESHREKTGSSRTAVRVIDAILIAGVAIEILSTIAAVRGIAMIQARSQRLAAAPVIAASAPVVSVKRVESAAAAPAVVSNQAVPVTAKPKAAVGGAPVRAVAGTPAGGTAERASRRSDLASGLLLCDSFKAPDGMASMLLPEVGPHDGRWLLRDSNAKVLVRDHAATIAPGTIAGLMTAVKSDGSFVWPARMRVEAKVRVGSRTGSGDLHGAGVGFWSGGSSGTAANADFYGLILNPNGSVSLWQGQNGSTAVERVSYPGRRWDPNDWYTLEYVVDSNTGRMESALLNGFALAFTQPTDFSVGHTQYVGVYLGAGDSAVQTPAARDLTVTTAK